MSTIPTATISRLVKYMRALERLEAEGVKVIPSEVVAERTGATQFLVRKDLAYFGRLGIRGSGYSVPLLRRELRRILGLVREWRAAVVGLGELGRSLARHPRLGDYSYTVKGLFDPSPEAVGGALDGEPILPLDALPKVVRERGIELALLAVPEEGAQEAADALAAAGVRGVLNLTPAILRLPDEIHVEDLDLLTGLNRLSFYVLNPHLREELA